jgi:GTP cyclohydrolase I
VQERLTEQIARTEIVLVTDDVAVLFDAVHMCVKMRG